MTPQDPKLRRFGALVAATLWCVVSVSASEPDGLAPPETPTSVDSRDPRKEDSRRIAVLPLTNHSGRGAPLNDIRALMVRRLVDRGFEMLGDEELAEFMRRHRMRYTAGLSREMAKALAAETGTWAALITTVDLYDERVPPKLALTSRLVSTEARPRILWMDSAVRVGDDAPGAFDLSLISDLDVLSEIVISGIAAAVPHDAPVLAAEGREPIAPSQETRWRFRPRAHYASPDFPIVRDGAARIAVLPFSNDATAKYAGQILTDQLVRHLVEVGADVVEPGVVRQVMLEARQFYREGPSVPETDILRLHLQADVVVFGEVSRYEEKLGMRAAQVEFLVRAIDTESRQLIWASNSYAGGSKGVYFFGAGQIHAAQNLASEMARALVGTVLRERARVVGRR
jgi:hypothetical protein